MSTNVDDRHNSISYRGRWTSLGGDSGFYGSTISATNNNGATATFKFRGTKVKLYLVVPIGSSGSVKIQANLDDRSPFIQERHAHPYTVYNDIWFEAGGLSNTEHTLVITNIGDEGGNAMQVDRFEIDGSPVSPQPPPQPPSPTPTPNPPAPVVTTTHIVRPVVTTVSSQVFTSTVIQTNTIVASQTASLTGGSSSSGSTTPSSSDTPSSTSGSSGSNTSTPSSSRQGSGDKTVTAIQIITTAPNGSVQTITTTPDQQGQLRDSDNEVPLGSIIGGAVGAVVLLAIALVLTFLLIRRRRKKRIMLGDDSERTTRQRGGISPFPAESEGDNPPNSATILRQPSNGTTTSNSRSRSGHHGFNSDEKQGDPFGSNSGLASDDNHSAYATPTSESEGMTALPLIETGGNNLNIRPHYLSGETLPADSPSIYSQAGPSSAVPRENLRLQVQDSHDVPPSYQSVGNRVSDVQQSVLNSAYLSYLSPRYSSGPGPGFDLGSSSAVPQAR